MSDALPDVTTDHHSTTAHMWSRGLPSGVPGGADEVELNKANEGGGRWGCFTVTTKFFDVMVRGIQTSDPPITGSSSLNFPPHYQ